MVDPTMALTTAINNATKVAGTPLFTTVIGKSTHISDKLSWGQK